MPIYELTLSQEFRGVETINRWNYVMSGTPAVVTGSFALGQAFGYVTGKTLLPLTPLGMLQAVQHSDVVFKNMVIKNLYSTTDFYELPFVSGTIGKFVTGESMPPFVSMGFRTNRVRSDISRGTKRFIGLSETWQANGQLIASALTGLDDVAEQMSRVLTYDDEGNTLSFAPAVCGKEKYATPSGRDAYRYYATEAEQLAQTATGVLWTPYSTTRSQTTRQYGRGI